MPSACDWSEPHHATEKGTMTQDILINWSPQETRVAVVEHLMLELILIMQIF